MDGMDEGQRTSLTVRNRNRVSCPVEERIWTERDRSVFPGP